MDIKPIAYCLLLSLLLAACTHTDEAAKTSQYGSNHGTYLTLHGTKLYYEEYGSGTPLLLLHQGLGSIETVSSLIPELSKHFRVIAPDAPGHGRSEQADSLSGDLLAEYGSALIDKLQLDSVYVMGWSMGGNTALLLAANRPDKVKKVVSGASNSKASGLTQEGRDLLNEYTVEAVKEDKDWLNHYQRLNPQPEKWVKFWEDNQKMWARESKVPDAKLVSIAVPVLLIRGDRDMIRLEHSIDLFRSLKQGQLCIYPNTGHDMPEQHSERLCQIALDFFNERKTTEASH
ncbi:alpha/beta fold hydrolase [Fibrella sp. WM1]|uniref:alpha/beta fold hydrolase n=1 Tax=Fibrella musci TaxID=3242485 RepID=UPI003522B321